MLLLTVALLFSRGCPLSASAVLPREADPASILLTELVACAETVDMRNVSLPVSELGGVYLNLLHSHPELFHVAMRLSYGYTETVVQGIPTATVTEVYPAYLLVGDDLTAARDFYRDTVSGILTEMESAFGDHPRTEADTVLYLHDLLADRYAYDTRTEGANSNAYSFFRDGKGICQAYALAFLALCQGAGVEADLVVSDTMNHAWNHVRVEGVWYHVDITRDDPIPAREGSEEVNHIRLLRSDGGMEALGYHGYSCASGHICTDTRYETPDGGAVLQSFSAPLSKWGDKWVGVGKDGGIAAAKVQSDGVYIGKVGDTDLNGIFDPADLLALYDPALPEKWRERMRDALTG